MYGTTQGSFKPSAEHCVLAHPIWPLCEKLKVVLLAKKSILRATVCCGATPSLCPPCTDGHGTTSKLGLQPQSLSELLYGGHRACSGCGKGACRRANATGRSTSANQRAASNQHSGALAGPVQDTSHRLTPGTLQSPRNPWIPQFKVEGWYQLHKAAPIFQSLV